MPGSTTQERLSTSSERSVQMLGNIDDDAVVDGLAALRGAAAARRDDPAVVPGNGKRPQRLVHGPGDHDAQRRHLVKRRIGRIPAPIERIEEDVARDLAPKTRGKGAVFSRILGLFGPRRRHRFDLV